MAEPRVAPATDTFAAPRPAPVRLSPDEVARYHADGYVVPETRLPDDAVAGLRAALDRLIAANPHMSSDAMFNPHVARGGRQSMVGDPAWLEVAGRPEVLDAVCDLIGPDVALWGSTLFGKPAAAGKATPWHQDGEYWPIRPLATCTCWIALDRAGPDNGCLRVIPGSHRARRLFRHHQDDDPGLTLNQALDAEEFDEARARDVVLEPGQMSFHDIYLVHGSAANRSAKRRAGYVLRFMPTTAHFDRELGAELERLTGAVDFATRPLYLLRGVDRCGLNDFAVGKG